VTQSITEAPRETPVYRETDVVVCGGGVAGCVAAITASRAGAKVLLVERYGYLGGIVTAWPVPLFYGFGGPEHQMVSGVAREINDRLRELGGYDDGGDWYEGDGIADCELLKWVLLEQLRAAGVELLLHSWVVDTITDGQTVTGVIVENKSGRQALPAKVTVDATGDGDLAPLSGAAYWTNHEPEDSGRIYCSLGATVEGVTTDPEIERSDDRKRTYARIIESLEIDPGLKVNVLASTAGRPIKYNSPDERHFMIHIDGDPCDAADLTRMETTTFDAAMRCLLAFREQAPGWENARLKHVAPQFGVREGRRYQGVATITRDEMESGTIHNDRIYRHTCGSEGKEYTIPLGCLIPRDVDGLVVGCRCLSVEKRAFAALRLIGHAEGIAMAGGAVAGLAAVGDVRPRDLPAEKTQRFLTETIGTYL
jgi:hypothetical protein